MEKIAELALREWKRRQADLLGARTFVSRAQLASLLVRSEKSEATAVSAGRLTLSEIRAELGDCRRCGLCEKRKNIVFGEGNEHAEILFIGEGPGEQEDLQGRPFVGPAGQLLDRIISGVLGAGALGLERKDVYIANVVKCRPPGNRKPLPEESASCLPFLMKQIEALKPKVIVALGGTALGGLLNDPEVKITRARGKFIDFQGIPMMPTFHPAYLLRNPEGKKEVFEDMKKVKNKLMELKGDAHA